jgi:hypothetical protein
MEEKFKNGWIALAKNYKILDKKDCTLYSDYYVKLF